PSCSAPVPYTTLFRSCPITVSMEFSVQERLILLSILPAEGDLTTLRIVRGLREQLSFSEEEHALLKFNQAENRVAWDAEAAKLIDRKSTRLNSSHEWI